MTTIKHNVKHRLRTSSVSEVVNSIENKPALHVTGSLAFGSSPAVAPRSREPVSRQDSSVGGFISDIFTLRWMTVPSVSFKMVVGILGMWMSWHILTPHIPNPFEPLVFISYPITGSPVDAPKYAKGYKDLLFVAYYIVVWSFLRQFLTLHVLMPFAKRNKVKKARLERFGEQGYAVLYFSFFGTLGVIVMSQLPTWWFRTEHFWIDYPYWQMNPLIKRYYLMQLAYWVQQLFVLVLGLEKPRKDFTALVIHHLVTIWLVGGSYTLNFTPFGNAIFLTMDISDVFLALAQCLNWLKMTKSSNITFAFFTCVWTYLRHYLNIVCLWSVYTQASLVPEHAKRWAPAEGVWMAWWVQWQIFAPLLLLQVVNIYWYFLILRILYRALSGKVLADDRTDDEDDEVPVEKKSQ